MRSFGVIVCLAALALTGYSAIVYQAPKIQADIQARTEQALARLTTAPVDIIVDGRNVTLRGTVRDDQERESLLQVAGEVWGGLGPVDGFERLTIMAPYRFTAMKDQNGKAVVEGFAPTVELRDQMSADAEAIFGDDTNVRIDLAAGAPEGDWRGIAGLGMDALAALERGKLIIADHDLSLVGDIAAAADVKVVEIFSDAAPDGFVWTNELSVPAEAEIVEAEETGETASLSASDSPAEEPDDVKPEETAELVEPFTFTVIKNTDGSLNIGGFAPDEATKQALIDQAKAVAADRPVVADIRIAQGMPNAAWPDLVVAGIGAMAQVESGKYEIIGSEASFNGNVVDDVEEAAIDGLTNQEPASGKPASDPEAKAAEADSPPEPSATISPYVMTLNKPSDGILLLKGVAPDEATGEKLLTALKQNTGVDDIRVEIEFTDGVPDDGWADFIADRAPALAAVRSGSLSFTGDETHLIGIVDTPEDADLVRTKLAAIDSAMTADLNPIDPRSAAAIELVISPDKGVTLWGDLPEGLTEQDVTHALGLGAFEGGLSEGGRGNADLWRKNLSAIGSYLPQFEHVGIKLDDHEPRIEGKLHSNGNVDQVADGLAQLFDAGQNPKINVSITELTHKDGSKRMNPLTGKEEVYDRGYWLPIVAFSPDLAECRQQSLDILAAEKITFLRGEATLDARAEKIVDSLAAVARKCLENGQLALRIGGHTDSRGASDMNETLSQARADVVLFSLTARGVDDASIVATGFGEAEPIADNETEGGRAKNRRITFEWKESGTDG